MFNRRVIKEVLPIMLISCLGIIAYSNTFHCAFHFDDTGSITDNFAIRNISDLQAVWNFLPRRFILYLSIALNYHFNRLDVFGYHLFNLVIHLISAILVWWLTRLTLSTPAMKENKITRHADLIALFAGLVFVAHPVQTEAVTYIVQRAASMATLFYVASLCFYVKSRLLEGESGSGLWIFYYIGSLLTAVLAMFTKEIAITLPLMILLYEFSFLRTRQGFNWVRLSPFLLSIFIIPLTMLLTESPEAQHMRGVLAERPSGISSMHYLLTQFRVMATYIRLMFLPLNQNLDYDYPISKSIFELPTLLSFLFLSAVLFYAQRLFSKYRLVSFSIFWFFLTLLPESSFLPIKDVIFEHRLYLPMVGYSMFLVSGVYYFLGKNSIKMMAIVVMMIIAFNSILTYQRNKVWVNELTLWDDAVQKSPHKARVYSSRGSAYYTQGNFARSISDFDKAIEIDPNYTDAYYNRGLVYYSQGNIVQALSDWNKTIEIDPDYEDVYSDRGLVYYTQGKFAQAISDYNRAIEIDPHHPQPYLNRGIEYYYQGKFAQAISDYNRAIEIDPDYTLVYYNRGHAYYQQKEFTQAVLDYSKAIELNPKYPEAYFNRAVTYYRLKKYDNAWADVSKAKGLGYAVNPKFINALKQATL